MKMAGDKLHTWRSLDSTNKECGGCVKIIVLKQPLEVRQNW